MKFIKEPERLSEALWELNEQFGEDLVDTVTNACQDYRSELLNNIEGVNIAYVLLDGEPYCADSLQNFVVAYEAVRTKLLERALGEIPTVGWIEDETEFMSLVSLTTELSMEEIIEKLPDAFRKLALAKGVDLGEPEIQ